MAQCWNLPQFASTAILIEDAASPFTLADLQIQIVDEALQNAVPLVVGEVTQTADLQVAVEHFIPGQNAKVVYTNTVDEPQDADLEVQTTDEELLDGLILYVLEDVLVPQAADLEIEITDEELLDGLAYVQVQVSVPQNAKPVIQTSQTYTAEALTRTAYPEAPGAVLDFTGEVTVDQPQDAGLVIKLGDQEIDPAQTANLLYPLTTDQKQLAKAHLVIRTNEPLYADFYVAVTRPDVLQDAGLSIVEEVDEPQDADLQIQVTWPRAIFGHVLYQFEDEALQDADLQVEVLNLEIDPAQTADLQVQVDTPPLRQFADTVVALRYSQPLNADLQVEIRGEEEKVNGSVTVALSYSEPQDADVPIQFEDEAKAFGRVLWAEGKTTFTFADLQIGFLDIDEPQDAHVDVALLKDITPPQTANLQVMLIVSEPQDADLQVEVQGNESPQDAVLTVSDPENKLIEQPSDLQVEVQGQEIDPAQTADLFVSVPQPDLNVPAAPVVAETFSSPHDADLQVEVQGYEIDPAQTADLQVKVPNREIDPAQTADLQVEITDEFIQTADLHVLWQNRQAPMPGHVVYQTSDIDEPQDADCYVAVPSEIDPAQTANLHVSATQPDLGQDADLQVEVQGQEIPGQDANLQVQFQDEATTPAEVLFGSTRYLRLDADVLYQVSDREIPGQNADLQVQTTDNAPQDANVRVVTRRESPLNAHVDVANAEFAEQNADLQVQVEDDEALNGRVQVLDGDEATQTCRVPIRESGFSLQEAVFAIQVDRQEAKQDANLHVAIADEEAKNDATTLVVTRTDETQDCDILLQLSRIRRQYATFFIALTREAPQNANLVVAEEQETYSGGPAGGNGYGEGFDR